MQNTESNQVSSADSRQKPVSDGIGTSPILLELLACMARLRDPEQGCPWDTAQTFASIVPHTLEEAYELAEAIETGEPVRIRDELGDLLLQVVFYAQIAAEQNLFDFQTIAAGLIGKLKRRHPHVFGEEALADAAAVNQRWEEIKAAERQQDKQATETVGVAQAGVLDGVALSLPALTRARKLQKRAASVGFDWSDPAPVFAKIEEELAEFRAELEPKSAAAVDQSRIEEEYGDVLFAVVNLARHAGVEPETALRRANRKFESRFNYIEQQLQASGRTSGQATLEEMDTLWDQAKTLEK
ncbi:MAG: nucleoside triphosphate pyrophosphohydrolase [Gammaproteobacteria bacterium]